MNLKEKHIIISGAGRGIGRIVAEELADQGASLALFSRTQQQLEKTLDIVKVRSPQSFYIVVDVSDHDEVVKAARVVKDRFGIVDGLVNNAGVQQPIGPLWENNAQDWKRNIEVNLFGSFLCAQAVLDEMIGRRKGKIINMSGGGATSPRPNFTAYAASKAAIVRLTETLAEEVRHYGIDINAVAPGAINTGMLEEIIAAKGTAGNEYEEAVRRKEQGGDDPRAVARLVAYLCSDDSDGITGKLISAVWDPWCEEQFQTRLRTDKDFATLRRIDEKHFTRR